MKYLICLTCITSLVLSCGNDDFKKYSQLNNLRILAVEADLPEINSAQTITLTPFISYPNGGDTNLIIEYKACLDPGIAYGASVSCDSLPTSQVLTGSSTFATSTIGSTNFYTGQSSSLSLNVPASSFIYLNSLDSKVQFNGYSLIVLITITDQNNLLQKVTVLKRVNLTSKTSGLNTNPTIGGLIQNNSVNLSSIPTTISNLTIESLSQAEAYQTESSSGVTNLNETMTISWFANFGEFKFSRTNKDESVEFDPLGATSGVIVGVYRDNRGGVKTIRLVL